MRRTPGWIVLAGIALELTALAFVARYLSGEPVEEQRLDSTRHGEREAKHASTSSAVLREAQDDEGSSVEAHVSTPLAFLHEPAGPDTRFYRASDEAVEVLAAFYGDGRVRIADDRDGRFAGMVSNARADLLDLANNAWSELFLRTTPEGRIQLELRGGPYDAHVLTCEAL